MIDINKAIEALDWKGKEPRGLYEPIAYALSTGGKRIRRSRRVHGNSRSGGRFGIGAGKRGLQRLFLHRSGAERF